jgi:hypothetical protein
MDEIRYSSEFARGGASAEFFVEVSQVAPCLDVAVEHRDADGRDWTTLVAFAPTCSRSRSAVSASAIRAVLRYRFALPAGVASAARFSVPAPRWRPC